MYVSERLSKLLCPRGTYLNLDSATAALSCILTIAESKVTKDNKYPSTAFIKNSISYALQNPHHIVIKLEWGMNQECFRGITKKNNDQSGWKELTIHGEDKKEESVLEAILVTGVEQESITHTGHEQANFPTFLTHTSMSITHYTALDFLVVKFYITLVINCTSVRQMTMVTLN